MGVLSWLGEKVKGSPLPGPKMGLVFENYVRHIVKHRPEQTAVTLVRERVPGTDSYLQQADIEHMLRELSRAVKGAEPALAHKLDQILMKTKSRVEPEESDWDFVEMILEDIEFS